MRLSIRPFLWMALLGLQFLSSTSFAYNSCNKYQGKDRYIQAIKTVAAYFEMDLFSLCESKKILDVEAQPHRIITRQGQIIPHMRVQLHYDYQSCYYMVRDQDQAITDGRCYSSY